MNRPEILEAARACVMQDRQATYDTPERNFATIAEFWTTYLGHPVASHDVAAMMALLKLARLKRTPSHQDGWIDLAGYAACGGEIATETPP